MSLREERVIRKCQKFSLIFTLLIMFCVKLLRDKAQYSMSEFDKRVSHEFVCGCGIVYFWRLRVYIWKPHSKNVQMAWFQLDDASWASKSILQTSKPCSVHIIMKLLNLWFVTALSWRVIKSRHLDINKEASATISIQKWCLQMLCAMLPIFML